jgi:large subunit ribosomal protein L24
LKIRANDNVLVIQGKDKGKQGKVQKIIRRIRKYKGEQILVIVDGVNMVKKHAKGKPGVRQAGIIDLEAPMDASKVALICIHCGKPTRTGIHYLEEGSRTRVCKKCQQNIE